jgi:hypothetical protein
MGNKPQMTIAIQRVPLLTMAGGEFHFEAALLASQLAMGITGKQCFLFR